MRLLHGLFLLHSLQAVFRVPLQYLSGDEGISKEQRGRFGQGRILGTSPTLHEDLLPGGGGRRAECQWPAQAFTTFNLKGSINQTNHRLYTSCTEQRPKGLKNIHWGKQETDGFPLPLLKLMLFSLSFVSNSASTPPTTTTTFSFNIRYAG